MFLEMLNESKSNIVADGFKKITNIFMRDSSVVLDCNVKGLDKMKETEVREFEASIYSTSVPELVVPCKGSVCKHTDTKYVVNIHCESKIILKKPKAGYTARVIYNVCNQLQNFTGTNNGEDYHFIVLTDNRGKVIDVRN
jgi:hypothetical protein